MHYIVAIAFICLGAFVAIAIVAINKGDPDETGEDGL